jgi:outer membrane protein, heavy metal efflux system
MEVSVHWSNFLILSTILTSAACGQSLADGSHAIALQPDGADPQAKLRESAAQATVEPLTIDQALALAEKNSPLLAEGTAMVSRAQSGIQTAKAYTNPTVDIQGGDQFARPIVTPGVPGILQHYGAAQTIEIPAERRARIRASRLGLTSTTHQFEGIRLALSAHVKRAFYEVLRRKQQLSYTKDNLALVEDLRRRVEKEVEVGEKGKLELTRAEAELARAHAAVRSADAQLANARAILKAALAVPTDQNYDPLGEPAGGIALPPLDELRAEVLARHPSLAEATSRTEYARTNVELERAKRIPQPNFFGEYERQPDVAYWKLGVNVAVPLWDRRKGPIGEAQAEARRWDALTQQRRIELMAALEGAYDQYQISDQQVLGLEAGSLREAQAAVDAARNAYKFGERGILEVLDAQRVLQGVRTDLLDALFARQSALINLEELGAMHP